MESYDNLKDQKDQIVKDLANKTLKPLEDRIAELESQLAEAQADNAALRNCQNCKWEDWEDWEEFKECPACADCDPFLTNWECKRPKFGGAALLQELSQLRKVRDAAEKLRCGMGATYTVCPTWHCQWHGSEDCDCEKVFQALSQAKAGGEA